MLPNSAPLRGGHQNRAIESMLRVVEIAAILERQGADGGSADPVGSSPLSTHEANTRHTEIMAIPRPLGRVQTSNAIMRPHSQVAYAISSLGRIAGHDRWGLGGLVPRYV